MPAKRGSSKAGTKTVNRREIVSKETEQTFIKALGLCSFSIGSPPASVDVRDGRIVRIRPFHYDDQYTKEEINPWKVEARGKVYEPKLKSASAPYMLAYKQRTYSPNRIKYPLKRVDWHPDGERNPQNRGKSKFKRISWDEATDIIAGEIRRVHKEYGPYAILLQGDGHGETKTLHGPHGCNMLLLDKMGSYTLQVRNPDSWEGWYWGSMHVWGTMLMGMMDPITNCFKDISEHSQMMLFWGCDPETTPWGFGGQEPTQMCYWWSELGINQVYVCPDLNYGAAVHADKWIPVLPNTDAALQLAIAYVWITEKSYDKKYVATHTVGFDKFAEYVLGKEDGIPKTPEWASKKCGVPEWTIKALAREWASRITSTVHMYGGSYVRGPYSTEPARLEVLLLGMQGLGKPGVHQYHKFGGIPRNIRRTAPFALQPVWSGRLYATNTKQIIPKTLIQEAILNPPVSSWGSSQLYAPVEDQFINYPYPIPEKEGGSEIHMMWTDTPCRTTCWNDGNRTIEALRNPKIECVVAQHPWLENDVLFSDIILPSNTKLEEEDIALSGTTNAPFTTLMFEGQCVKPVGESRSDYEVVGEVAKKLGKYKEYTDGMTNRQWLKRIYEFSGLKDSVSWEELNEKGYYIIPTDPNWEKESPGLRKFYKDPQANPLKTPSGKLEFYSKRLAQHFPDDKERPPSPKWIEKGISHDERISSERARMFPLLLMSNHGRWRMHAQGDDIAWTREAPTCKVKGWDGYMYEPVWINPVEAAKRGIQHGGIVKVFNERGAVLGGAYVTERIMPGVAYVDHGARVDPIIPGKLDRGGAINLISPYNITSKNCAGMATSGYLVEVERVSMAQMEEWRKQYPEAFQREYDPASGLRFNAWVEE